MKNIIKFFAFLSVGVIILYFVYQSQNEAYQAQCILDGVPADNCSLVNKVIDDFKSVKISWLAAAFIAYLISNTSRAFRWKMLLKPLGRNVKLLNSFLTIMLGYFANLGLPRSGEVLRPLSLSKYENIPLEKVLGTIVVDRVMDVLSLLIIICLAFMLEYDTLWGYLSENMNAGEKKNIFTHPVFIALLGIGGVAITLALVFRKKIIQSNIYQKIEELLKGFLDGILSIKKLDRPWLFILHSIIIWVGYYLMFYFYMPAFGPTENLGFIAALMVFVFGTFGIVIPSPGGMGSYHFLVIAALTIYGVNNGDAFSSANISFFSTHFCNVILGLAAIIFLPVINKDYHPKELDLPEEQKASNQESKHKKAITI